MGRACNIAIRERFTRVRSRMIVAMIVATLFGFTALQSGQNVARGTAPQQQVDEVVGLLKQTGLPESPTTKRVRAQLVLMANQSPNLRKTVVEALIRVLNDPRGELDLSGVYQSFDYG